MIQPKIVVRNTISGRRPPAPERREKPGRRQEGIQGGGKLTPLPTTGCRLARIRQAVQGTQGGDKREARAEERPLPPRAEASSRPYQPRGITLPAWAWGYAMFYVSIQSFDDKDKPPAVSRGGACLRPGVGGSLASALGLGASSALRCALGPGCGLF